MKVIEYIPVGNSFPLIIENQNQKTLVKLRAGMSGEYAMLNEWFGNMIGKQLGINTRQPNWINLSDDLEYEHIYIEVRDLIDKSKGINISFDYLENAKELSLIEIEKLDKRRFVDLYLLDVLMLNIDRTWENLNLLQNPNGEIVISDFESSLFLNELLKNRSISSEARVLECLKSNPFHQQIERNELNSFLKRLGEIDFDLLISQLPSGTITPLDKAKLKGKLTERKNAQWDMMERLDIINKTTVENQEEKRQRTKDNREKLEKLLNSK